MTKIIRLSLSYQATTNMGATLRFSLNPLISHINYHLLSRSQKDPHIYAVRQLSIKSNYIAWHENKIFKTKKRKKRHPIQNRRTTGWALSENFSTE